MEEQGIVEVQLAKARPSGQNALGDKGVARAPIEQIHGEGSDCEKVIGAAVVQEVDDGVPGIKQSTDENDNEGPTESAQHGRAATTIGAEAKSRTDGEGTGTNPKPPSEGSATGVSQEGGESQDYASKKPASEKANHEFHNAETNKLTKKDHSGDAGESEVSTSQWLLGSEILAFASQKQAAEPLSHGSVTDIMRTDATIDQQMSKNATTDQQMSNVANTDQQSQRGAMSGREPSEGNGGSDTQPKRQQQQHLDDLLSSQEDDSSSDSSEKSQKYEAVVKSIRESLARSWGDQEWESEIETENADCATEQVGMEQSSITDEALSVPEESAGTELTRNEVTVSSSLQNTEHSPPTEEPEQKLTYRESLVKSLREKFEKGPEYNINNLSVDLEEFYFAQRAQNAEYKTKRREALSRNHGAEEVHGHGVGEVDHSPMDEGIWISTPDVHSFDKHDAESKVNENIEDVGTDLAVDTFIANAVDPEVEEGENTNGTVPDEEVDTFVENDDESRIEESKDREDAGPDVEADADEMLAYLAQVWWDEPGDLSENVTSLLSFLTSGEGEPPVFPPQEIVDALRCRRWDFCGRRRNGQSEEKWVDNLLQQLCFNYLRDLEQQQIASRHTKVMEANNPDEDFEVDEALASLNSVLSDLESHIDALKSSKNNTMFDGEAGAVQSRLAPKDMENMTGSAMQQLSAVYNGETKQQDFGLIDPYSGTHRTIGCGELYSASRWEMLEENPACRLKNKIVLADKDEVETVAVILKVDQDQHRAALDRSNLCVLNNEKPSALKTRVSDGRHHRVQFMLKQESAGVGEADSKTHPKQPETSAICCWLC